jgi:hypothetical protein
MVVLTDMETNNHNPPSQTTMVQTRMGMVVLPDMVQRRKDTPMLMDMEQKRMGTAMLPTDMDIPLMIPWRAPWP